MKYLIVAFLLLAMPAFAQQPQPPSPEVQALQAKLMQELNASLQCTTQVITLGQENAKLKAEIEELRKAKEPGK